MTPRPHDLGFVPERDLVQMRVPLPLPPEVVASARPVSTRPFQPGRDDAAWLAINNAAFADHPEQGRWTLDDLHEHMKFDWFDLEGFLVADRPDGNGLLGSCWTKIHRTTEPVLGEIYVISVDPALHSQGWGRALTVAGLQWMAGQGVTVGMLYVTGSNTAAVKLYESLGFTVDHVDRSYLLTPELTSCRRRRVSHRFDAAALYAALDDKRTSWASVGRGWPTNSGSSRPT